LPTRLHDLTPIQIAYYLDNHRFVINPAGRRSRKTLIGKRKLLNRALLKPGRYFHGAPTHKQAKDIFWDGVVKDTRLLRKDKSETDLMVKLYNDSEIHIVGLDKPERIEGQEWHGCHITEFGNLKGPLAWLSNIRPVLSDTNGWALLDGVPEGRNFYYDMALKACSGAIPITKAGKGSFADCGEWAYFHWFSSDVLSQEEIEDVRSELDERTYRQEYEGSYETYEGAAYKEFGQHNLDSSIVENISGIVSIGMDFNVDPMTAVCGHVESDTFKQFGEIWLNNSNTFEMRDEILRRFHDPRRIVIYPDSTGDSERSNAHKTDIQILKEAGFQVRAKTHNPEQRDRINNVNSFIKDRGVKTRYKINPKTCPKTVNDMNKRESLADGRLDKEQEKEMKIGHISDAFGYLVSYLFPIVRGIITGLKI
jgi:hypothetical protein